MMEDEAFLRENETKKHEITEFGIRFRKKIKNSVGQQMIWQLQETWTLQGEFSSSILPIA
jgi:hypothetical protein